MFSLALKEEQKKEEVSLWHSPEYSRGIKWGCLVANTNRIFTVIHLSLAPPPTQQFQICSRHLLFEVLVRCLFKPKEPQVFLKGYAFPSGHIPTSDLLSFWSQNHRWVFTVWERSNPYAFFLPFLFITGLLTWPLAAIIPQVLGFLTPKAIHCITWHWGI